MRKDALISDCGRFRYFLSRIWDENKGKVLWWMFNPSTADASTDDPTIRRCMGFAARWGYGGIGVTNLYPLRTKSPKELYKRKEEITETVMAVSTQVVQDELPNHQLVVIAWGDAVPHKQPISKIDPAYCLGWTKKGNPKHPLYVPYNTELIKIRNQ